MNITIAVAKAPARKSDTTLTIGTVTKSSNIVMMCMCESHAPGGMRRGELLRGGMAAPAAVAAWRAVVRCSGCGVVEGMLAA